MYGISSFTLKSLFETFLAEANNNNKKKALTIFCLTHIIKSLLRLSSSLANCLSSKILNSKILEAHQPPRNFCLSATCLHICTLYLHLFTICIFLFFCLHRNLGERNFSSTQYFPALGTLYTVHHRSICTDLQAFIICQFPISELVAPHSGANSKWEGQPAFYQGW